MISFKSFEQKLFRLDSDTFEPLALQVFQFQAVHNPIYQEYLSKLNIKIDNVKRLTEIPFMPISFFKNHIVKSGHWDEEAIFKSSGTTGQKRSQHAIRSLAYYNQVSQHIFEATYGKLEEYTFLALLPSYLEQGDSSLVYMLDGFIKRGADYSGFYLHNYEQLIDNLKRLKKKKKTKILLIGVSYALLDLAEQYPMDLSDVLIMETGGMKGRRREMVRSELHQVLKASFSVENIHSEYGMTELLSQAYAKANGVFYTPPWMKILVRDLNDPFDLNVDRMGGINVIDLANVDTCSFIETQDMGVYNANGSFEILGRIDNSEIRGCNLLVTNY